MAPPSARSVASSGSVAVWCPASGSLSAAVSGSAREISIGESVRGSWAPWPFSPFRKIIGMRTRIVRTTTPPAMIRFLPIAVLIGVSIRGLHFLLRQLHTDYSLLHQILCWYALRLDSLPCTGWTPPQNSCLHEAAQRYRCRYSFQR